MRLHIEHGERYLLSKLFVSNGLIDFLGTLVIDGCTQVHYLIIAHT